MVFGAQVDLGFCLFHFALGHLLLALLGFEILTFIPPRMSSTTLFRDLSLLAHGGEALWVFCVLTSFHSVPL